MGRAEARELALHPAAPTLEGALESAFPPSLISAGWQSYPFPTSWGLVVAPKERSVWRRLHHTPTRTGKG